MSQNKRKINKRAAIRLASFFGLAVSLLCLALGWLFHRGFALPGWLGCPFFIAGQGPSAEQTALRPSL